MDLREVCQKMDDLKKRPELADTPGYDVEEMRKSTHPIFWFQFLMEQPQFAPPEEEAWWFDLQDRSDLPWAKLLAKQPQFEQYCHWESVSRLELLKLAYLAPDLFEKHFPQGRPWDLWAFLTPQEKMYLLAELPQLENQADWDELNGEWDTEDWVMLLAKQPQFEKYFDWSRIEKNPSVDWAYLLQRQPQFAGHCDFALLDDIDIKLIKRSQPQLFEGEDKD